jgi:hypothetical protein
MGDCHFHYGEALWQVSRKRGGAAADEARAIALVTRSVADYGKAPRLEPRRKKAEAWLKERAGPH